MSDEAVGFVIGILMGFVLGLIFVNILLHSEYDEQTFCTSASPTGNSLVVEDCRDLWIPEDQP